MCVERNHDCAGLAIIVLDCQRWIFPTPNADENRGKVHYLQGTDHRKTIFPFY